jgi:ribonuclease P protein component
MPAIESLSGKPHFARVRARGNRCTRDGLTAFVCVRDEGPARLGLAVGKAAGKAVVRNKIRRRLRAAVRAYGPGAADVVLVGRASLATEPYARVEEYVRACLSAAGAPRGAA